MNLLQQIQRGVDYIEAHLDTHVDLREVSRAAGISHSHFQRMFKALTGETVKTYVRARRMAQALDMLLCTDARILDVAVAAGFESQEAFARAFKRAFGMTPSAYRKIGSKALFLKKVRFDERYLEHVEQGVATEPEIVERSSMRVVGMRTDFYGPYSDKNNLGDQLHILWSAFVPRAAEVPHAAAPLPYYGVVRQDPADDERLEYYAAREVTCVGAVPRAMQATEVPGGRYAVFNHRGPPRAVDQTVDYVYTAWLARSDYRHTYGPDLEIYDERWQPGSPDSEMAYAIPIARR